jgi:hypothetical protein
MSIRMNTGPDGLPGVPRSRKSGIRKTAVPSAVSRVSSHFGRELSLPTTPHAAVAPATPSTVSSP